MGSEKKSARRHGMLSDSLCDNAECGAENITGTVTRKEKTRLAFYKVMCIYLLGGFAGTAWETLLNFCRGNGFVYCNGSLFTPFNFVYGFGAVIITLCLQNQSDARRVWLTGALGGGAVEYIINFLEEKLLGTRSWDYEGRLLNINGRTTLVYMAFWGLLCVVMVFLILRPLDRFLERLPSELMTKLAVLAAILCAVDLLITVGAIFRYAERSAGREGTLWIARMLDRFCNDDFMKIRFPHLGVK